jgi:hypothetical protein
MINESEAVRGMKIGRASRNTPREPAPMPLRLPQMPLVSYTWIEGKKKGKAIPVTGLEGP